MASSRRTARLRDIRSLTYAFVATHNHFVFDRSGQVGQSDQLQLIKLPEAASENDYLGLLGVLNSSTACFWLKQVCHPKGATRLAMRVRGQSRGMVGSIHEFTGTKLEQFPLPTELPLEFGRKLDALAQRLSSSGAVGGVCRRRTRRGNGWTRRGRSMSTIRGRMIALQEELDWDVYRRYGLLSDAGGGWS